MQVKLKNIETILKEQKQEELLKYPYSKQCLNTILEINFEQLNKLYKEAIKKEEKIQKKIEPISYIEKEKLSEQERKKYEQIGADIIKQGEYAVVTMAGGQRNKIRT